MLSLPSLLSVSRFPSLTPISASSLCMLLLPPFTYTRGPCFGATRASQDTSFSRSGLPHSAAPHLLIANFLCWLFIVCVSYSLQLQHTLLFLLLHKDFFVFSSLFLLIPFPCDAHAEKSVFRFHIQIVSLRRSPHIWSRSLLVQRVPVAKALAGYRNSVLFSPLSVA